MTIARREALILMITGTAGATLYGISSPVAAMAKGPQVATMRLPSFELQGSTSVLAKLSEEVTEYSVERWGKSTSAVWLRGRHGESWFLTVDRRDALPMFEVFTLGILTLEALQSRWREWKAPAVTSDIPEPLKTLMATRPPMPTPPSVFRPWPFKKWRTQVLRRAEFIVENGLDAPTVGKSPNFQSATNPMTVPAEASATCEVAAGILFCGPDNERLLMAVDWMPLNMIVTEKASEIDEYVVSCEAIDLAAYLERRSNT